MKNRLAEFWRDESGVAMSEYALMLALVSVGLLAVLVIFRDAIGWVFDKLSVALRVGTESAQGYESASFEAQNGAN